jgi:hypothetical protein
VLHCDTAEVLIAVRIVHRFAAEHGENLHSSRVVAVHDIDTTSDEQEKHRKQQRQANVKALLHFFVLLCGCKVITFRFDTQISSVN